MLPKISFDLKEIIRGFDFDTVKYLRKRGIYIICILLN